MKKSIFINKTLSDILREINTSNLSGKINSFSIIGSVFAQILSQYKGSSTEETLINLSRAFPDMSTEQLLLLVDNI
jgi:hypothetical protein